MKIKLKIIGGIFKRRYIEITKNNNLRPILTRVRQTIFDILFNLVNLEESRFFDVCCGSGILGLESFSRGSREGFFLDISRETCNELKNNCIKLDVFHKSKIFNKNALTPPVGTPVDIIFLDISYISNFLVKKILRKLEAAHWINDETIIVVPLDKKFKQSFEEQFHILKHTVISSTRVFFLQRKTISVNI